MRLRVLLLGLVGSFALVPAGQALAADPPTVGIAASPTAVSVAATGPLAAGPTRFELTGPASGADVAVYVIVLVPGFTIDDLLAELALEDTNKGFGTLGMASVRASATVASGAKQAVTMTLKPGLTYYVLAEPDTDSNGKVRQRAVTSFTTSLASNGTTVPRPDAYVFFQGLRFRGSGILPLKGTVRFTNRDSAPHFALAFPLRAGITTRQLGSAIMSSSPAAFGRIVAGAPVLAQSVLSGGYARNDQELTFTRPGRYGLVCFIDGHDQLGMYKVVTVK